MNFRLITRASVIVTLAAASAGAVVACSEGGGAKTAIVHAGDMPAGESWNGVYFHPVFGYLHMVENDATIVGKWQRADKSKWGELSGTKLGNVLHFSWKEHTYGLVGPAAVTAGKGVFVYRTEDVNEHKQSKLDGQYGLDQDEVGNTWNCVKQDRMEPKLDSINGDVSATGAPPPAGKWDEK